MFVSWSHGFLWSGLPEVQDRQVGNRSDKISNKNGGPFTDFVSCFTAKIIQKIPI